MIYEGPLVDQNEMKYVKTAQNPSTKTSEETVDLYETPIGLIFYGAN